MLGYAYLADFAYCTCLAYLLSLLRLPYLPSLLCLLYLLRLLSRLCRFSPTRGISGSFLQIIACASQARIVTPQARVVPKKKVAGPVPRAGISRLCPPPNHCLSPPKVSKVTFGEKKLGQVESTPCSRLRFCDDDLFFVFDLVFNPDFESKN